MNKKSLVKKLFFLIALFLVYDIYEDYKEGASTAHFIFEGFLTSLAIAGFYSVSKTNVKLEASLAENTEILKICREESAQIKQESQKLAQSFINVILDQFEKWNFSKTESEVALLLIKGMSFKEIAELRHNSEKTIRQHSLKIYEKSNLGGRAELAAYFLKELFQPTPDKPSSTSPQ